MRRGVPFCADFRTTHDRRKRKGRPSGSGFRIAGFVLDPRAMRHFLDFEKQIAELEGKIEELRRMSEPEGLNIADEVAKLTEKADRQLRATYAKLTPWQKTQVARHPDRPKAHYYLDRLITEFTPLAGDRAFADE